MVQKFQLQRKNHISTQQFANINSPIRLNLFGEEDRKIYTTTRIGVLLSMAASCCVILYLVILIRSMRNQVFDDLNTVIIHNNFNDIGKIYVLNHTSILPIIQLGFLAKLSSNIDIFQDSQSHLQDENLKKIDVNKLSQYIKIMIVANKKVGGSYVSSYYKQYRICKDSDFEKIQNEQKSKINTNNYLCADIDQSLKNHLILKDGYIGTLDERYSFSIEVQLCHDVSQNCKPHSQLDELLRSMLVTQYIIEEQADLANYSNLNESPIVTRLRFFQQFILDSHQYRDNNNFVRFNKVETKDSKYLNIFQNEYQYFDVTSEPVFYAHSPFYVLRNVTYDGVNYQAKTPDAIISGQYFFLSDRRQEHSRQIGSYIDIFSMLGGLSSIIFSFTAFISSAISYRFIVAEIIYKIYQIKQDQNNGSDQKTVQIRDQRIQKYRKSNMFDIQQKITQPNKEQQKLEFTTFDIVSNIWIFKPLRLLLKNSKFIRNYDLFDKLMINVEDDLQISNIILNNKLISLMNQQLMKTQNRDDDIEEESYQSSESARKEIVYNSADFRVQTVELQNTQQVQNSQHNLIEQQDISQ